MIFKGSGATDQVIWLGRTISKLGWRNNCILKNNSRGTKNIEGAKVTQSGYAVNAQWYTQNFVGVLEYVIDNNIPGVRQGDNLSPVLFLFMISAFAEVLETEWGKNGMHQAEFGRVPTDNIDNQMGQLLGHNLNKFG